MFSIRFLFNQVKQLQTFRSMSAAVQEWLVSRKQFLELPLEAKRKNYKCGDKYVTLSNIPSWEEQFNSSSQKVATSYRADKNLNKKISMFVGDITALEIDAIVNAANNALGGGGGVDGAIHAAAGKDILQAECRTLNGCQTGDAKITGGYKLPAKCKYDDGMFYRMLPLCYTPDIIHTVGPVGEKPDKLKSCYVRSLEVMKTNGLRTIAFPCVSTGVYGYPNEAAANVALSATREWLEMNSSVVDRIIFCLFLEIDINIYKRLLPTYFPRE